MASNPTELLQQIRDWRQLGDALIPRAGALPCRRAKHGRSDQRERPAPSARSHRLADQALAEARKNDSPDFQREVLRLEALINDLVAQPHARTNTL